MIVNKDPIVCDCDQHSVGSLHAEMTREKKSTDGEDRNVMLHSHQIKIATDWLQTGSRLASDSKIGVNGTMLYQYNPTVFYQSEASWKPV